MLQYGTRIVIVSLGAFSFNEPWISRNASLFLDHPRHHVGAAHDAPLRLSAHFQCILPDDSPAEDLPDDMRVKIKHIFNLVSNQRTHHGHAMIGDSLYACSYTISGDFETRGMELKLRKLTDQAELDKEATFQVKLPVSASSSLKFLASYGAQVWAQIQIEGYNSVNTQCTYIFNVEDGSLIDLPRDLPIIADCLLGCGVCLYRVASQPSLITMLDLSDFSKKVRLF